MSARSPALVGASRRRDLRAIYAEGVSWSVMVGVGESYLAAFALALGLGEVVAGLVATVPFLAGGVVQLVTPAGVRWLGSRRKWAVGCATVQALSFLPFIAGAISGRFPTWAIFVVATCYWAAGMAAGPAWNVWMEELVPRRLRAPFFARRSGAVHLGVLLGLATGGLVLQVAEGAGDPLVGFAVIFAVAAGFRAGSARVLALQSERSPIPMPDAGGPSALRILQRRPGEAGGRLVVYLMTLTAGVAIASPYFSPYMLVQLDLSYVQYMSLVGSAMLAKVIVLSRASLLVRKLGLVHLLRLAWIGIVIVPALWVLSDRYAYLVGLQALGGTVWAIHEYVAFLLLFETIQAGRRVAILTAFNLGNAAATVGGSLVGAGLFSRIGGGSDAYFTIFILSSVWRLSCVFLLARVWVGAVIPAPPVFRPVAVRPSLGLVLRPILATVRRPSPAGDPPTPDAPEHAREARSQSSDSLR